MLRLVLFFLSVFAGVASSDPFFRFGAVLTHEGTTTKDMIEARKGYALYFDMVNALHGGRGFFLRGKDNTTGFHFRFEFIWRDDHGDPGLHAAQVTQLVEEENVHFLGGSHADYAQEEMRIAAEHGVLNYQCCVEPDVFYDNGYRTVFGITASNEDYMKSSVRAMQLAEISATAMVVDMDDILTRTTCEAAIALFGETATDKAGFNASERHLVYPFNRTTVTKDLFPHVVQRSRENAVEAVVACVLPDDGKDLVDAFHNARYPLKSFFLTIGPTKQDWVDSFEPRFRSDSLFSATQWHPEMKYRDDFFGKSSEYKGMYEERYDGETPTVIAAGASAVGLTLTQAIQDAFRTCNISGTNGDVDALLYDPKAIICDDRLTIIGYDRVLRSLAALNIETFFGKVKFNDFGRNAGLETVTTQVFQTTTEAGTNVTEIKPVMPLSYATELPKYPARNYYVEDCEPGYFFGGDAFEPCYPCPRGEASEKMNADHCESCPIGEYNAAIGQSTCEVCPEGTSTVIRGATSKTNCSCIPGYFNAAGQLGVECEPCPVGASCKGGTEAPIPMSGYWANATFRTYIYQCDPPSVCLGGDNVTCEVGYTGRLCAECETGYFSVIQKCYKCLDSSVIVVLCIALLVGWYVINVIVSKSVSSLEMILGWAQLANIIGDVNLNWTKSLTTMFGVANLLDFDVDILEPSCLFSWGFRQNIVVQLCLPFIMSLLAAIGYLSSTITHLVIVKHKWIRLSTRSKEILSLFVNIPEDEGELAMKWDATIAAFLASVDITYVTIAKYCFDVFKCEDIAGVRVLRESPDVVCTDSAEYNTLMILASCGIAFYVIGFPAYKLWKLYDLSNRSAFSNPVNLRRFGFIYEKYELDYYFTPAINIIRKLLFVLVLVYMNNPAFQIGTLAILINASLMIHVYTAPYVDTYLDVLFSFLLVALMGEAFGGLMFYSENLPAANREILEWVVMTTMFLLTFVFLAIFMLEIIRKYHVRYLKNEHLKFVQKRFGPINTIFSLRRNGPPRGPQRLLSLKKRPKISYELLDTFRPGFVYASMRKSPELVEDWDRLTTMLKDYMSDQSETSYLSMDPIAKFWRKLVDRFPELVDFLAVADDAAREKFNDFATNLYRNFYLSNKVTPLPLLKILNWRDYAPMAQWLAIAPAEDRKFFVDFVSRMFHASENDEDAQTMQARIENGGPDPQLVRRLSNNSLSRKKRRILQSYSSGSHPFYHSASGNRSRTVNVLSLGISKLSRRRRRTLSAKGTESGNLSDERPSDVDEQASLEEDKSSDSPKEKDESDNQQEPILNIQCTVGLQEIEMETADTSHFPNRRVTRSVTFQDDEDRSHEPRDG